MTRQSKRKNTLSKTEGRKESTFGISKTPVGFYGRYTELLSVIWLPDLRGQETWNVYQKVLFLQKEKWLYSHVNNMTVDCDVLVMS